MFSFSNYYIFRRPDVDGVLRSNGHHRGPELPLERLQVFADLRRKSGRKFLLSQPSCFGIQSGLWFYQLEIRFIRFKKSFFNKVGLEFNQVYIQTKFGISFVRFNKSFFNKVVLEFNQVLVFTSLGLGLLGLKSPFSTKQFWNLIRPLFILLRVQV